MTLRQRLTFPLVFFVAHVVLLLGIAATIAVLSADSASSLVPTDVRERVLRGARVRVIVELRLSSGPHVSEGLLPTAAIGVQRRDIAGVRRQLLGRLSGRNHAVLREYATVPLVALEIGRDALADLEASGFWVTRVMPDTIKAPSLPQSGPLIGADQAWNRGFDGSGAIVAILDTGVQSSHSFLAGKVVEEACYSSTVSGRSLTLCPNGQDEQLGAGSGTSCPLPECWHGTHVAGIAAGNGASAGKTFSGVAKGADVMSVQVYSRFDDPLDCRGAPPCVLAWTSDIIAGLERVYTLRGARNFAAANLSLGSGLFSQPCGSEPETAIIDNLRSVGIATVIAAGNDGATNALSSPGCIPSAISVGATTKTDQVATFSNVAPFMSLFAPGDSIVSSLVGGDFGAASGTSMAAPHVAGAWAILKQAAPDATVSQILAALQTTGLPITDPRPFGSATKPRVRIAEAMTALVPTLGADPTTLEPGGTVTATWSGLAAPTPTDWIGLYALGTPDAAYRAWMYVGCSQSPGPARAAGSCPVPLPSDLPPGTYELRLFASDGFGRLATSGSFAINGSPTSATLSASPPAIAAGGTVTAVWSGIAGPTPSDWIGLYVPGSGDGAYQGWIYVSCSQSTASARAGGSCPFTLPSDLPPGNYELRLFGNGGFTRVATSGGITVSGPTPATLSVSPATVAAGGTVTAAWSGIAGPTSSDWIGLYVPGTGDGAYRGWIYVSCSQSTASARAGGSCPFALPSDLPPGSYELRLFSNGGFTRLATSHGLTVTP